MSYGKDKRRFKRYPKKSEAAIVAGDRQFKAETLDYSFDGVRAVFSDDEHVKVGDVLNLSLTDPDISTNGEVMWASKADGLMSIGIRMTGVLSGSMRDFSLADIMLGFQRAAKTGVLHITYSRIRKTVYVDKGVMVFAESNDPADRLGQLLLARGTITPEQYERSSNMVRKVGKRQGLALVELGYLTPKELIETVKDHVETIIQSLFGLSAGQFMFKECPLPTEEVVKLKLSAANIIYKGIKAFRLSEDVAATSPAPASIPYFSPDPLNLFQSIDIDEGDRSLLRLVDGKNTISEIVEKSDLSEEDARKSLNALMSTMILEVLEKPVEDPISAEKVFGGIPKEEALKSIERIEKMFDEHEQLGYYGVLGVGRDATSAEVKRAYYEKARFFHPDRHFDLPDEVKGKINTIFTYITGAYSTLVSSALRTQYDDTPSPAAGTEGISKEQLATERFHEGIASLKDANFPDAAKLFGAAAYLDSEIAKYHYFAGIALGKNKQRKDSERALNRALRLDPFNPAYLAEAGHAYLALELPLRARGNFEKALKIQPSNKRAEEGVKMLDDAEEASRK